MSTTTDTLPAIGTIHLDPTGKAKRFGRGAVRVEHVHPTGGQEVRRLILVSADGVEFASVSFSGGEWAAVVEAMEGAP